MKYNLPDSFKSKLKYKFDLSKSIWFQTGGITDLYCQISNYEDLKIILSQTHIDTPIFVMGAGSNILVRDGGYRGIIVKLGKGFNNIEIKNDQLISGAAVLDSTLSKFASNNSIKNFEFFSGIPGTVGGAVKMNAGCFGSETKDVVEGVIVINRLGEEKFIDLKDLNLGYRTSAIKDNLIIKEIIFKAKSGDSEQIKFQINEILDKRELSQPLKVKTGGSTFKNPKGYFAAKLIEESGCKGMCVGGAIVSSKHANFIINKKNASATDIESLGEKIREKVLLKFNILLDWEIKIIGNKL